jgi:hypothetical protein
MMRMKPKVLFQLGNATRATGARLDEDRRDEAAAPRLRTRVHLFGRLSGASYFRVVAWLADGSEALVCLAGSRSEAIDRARSTGWWNRALRVELQRWIGTGASGRWVSVSTRGDEWPRPPRPRSVRVRRPIAG